jgi:hypothetical protein
MDPITAVEIPAATRDISRYKHDLLGPQAQDRTCTQSPPEGFRAIVPRYFLLEPDQKKPSPAQAAPFRRALVRGRIPKLLAPLRIATPQVTRQKLQLGAYGFNTGLLPFFDYRQLFH